MSLTGEHTPMITSNNHATKTSNEADRLAIRESCPVLHTEDKNARKEKEVATKMR
jgi:hypothetical protein